MTQHDKATAPISRKRWVTPEVALLSAADAENGANRATPDAVFTFS